MKKYKFFRTLPMKIYLALTALVVFAFLSNDFGLVDIQKTALVLAAAVDKTDENFEVSLQIAIPKAESKTAGGTSSVTIKNEGETVSDCVNAVYAKTGWVPKLVFCDLILLGEEACADALSCLDYFLRNEYVNDNCYLAACEGSAGELLSSSSAIDDTSCLAIEKLFSTSAEKSGAVQPQTLREFSISCHGAGKSGVMPLISMTEQATSGEASAQEGESESGEKKIYNASQTALFYEGSLRAVLNAEQSFALHLLNGNVKTGVYLSKEEEKPVSLQILKDDGKISLDMDGAPKAEIRLSLKTRLFDRGTPAPAADIARSVPGEETLNYAKEEITRVIEEIWDLSLETGCDLFSLKTKLYRSSKRKFEEWESVLFSVITPKIEVSVQAAE